MRINEQLHAQRTYKISGPYRGSRCKQYRLSCRIAPERYHDAVARLRFSPIHSGTTVAPLEASEEPFEELPLLRGSRSRQANVSVEEIVRVGRQEVYE